MRRLEIRAGLPIYVTVDHGREFHRTLVASNAQLGATVDRFESPASIAIATTAAQADAGSAIAFRVATNQRVTAHVFRRIADRVLR
jgi:hypothetical protein